MWKMNNFAFERFLIASYFSASKQRVVELETKVGSLEDALSKAPAAEQLTSVYLLPIYHILYPHALLESPPYSRSYVNYVKIVIVTHERMVPFSISIFGYGISVISWSPVSSAPRQWQCTAFVVVWSWLLVIVLEILNDWVLIRLSSCMNVWNVSVGTRNRKRQMRNYSTVDWPLD